MTTLYLVSYSCRPRAILDIIRSGEDFRISFFTKMPEQGTCERCGYILSQVSSPQLLPTTTILSKRHNFMPKTHKACTCCKLLSPNTSMFHTFLSFLSAICSNFYVIAFIMSIKWNGKVAFLDQVELVVSCFKLFYLQYATFISIFYFAEMV